MDRVHAMLNDGFERCGSEGQQIGRLNNERLQPRAAYGPGRLGAVGSMIGSTSAAAQGSRRRRRLRSVRRMRERLPYYGVFDYIVFRVDSGTVYLAGTASKGAQAGGTAADTREWRE